MATAIRFGNNVFQKEKKIILLEKELSDLQTAYASLQSQTNSFQACQTSSEKIISEYQQKCNFQEIEILAKNDKISHLLKEKEIFENEKAKILKENEEFRKINEKLRENLGEASQKLIFASDLEIRLRQEIRSLEGNNEKFERKMEGLLKTLEEKKENIEILEKSINQKDKFNAIIMKEKERLMKITPFEGLVKEKQKETKNVKINNNNNKENLKKFDNKEKERENMEDFDGVRQKLKIAENEVEKLKKENFELSVRLKNKK